MIFSEVAGRVIGAFGGSDFEESADGSDFCESDSGMTTNQQNAELALETLQANLKEISEMIKRTGDRMTVVLGATITGFGLIARLNDNTASGWSLLILGISILALLATFGAVVAGLFPKQGDQPGSTDVDEIWQNIVCVESDAAIANTMNDLCLVIRNRREINEKMNWWFRATVVNAAVALSTVAISEAISSVG